MTTETVRNTSITSSLYIQGWRHLDAVLLAALATEFPVLLIGPHGTAKTLLVERLAEALALEYRHYNASLLNYDDLVGIPIPEEEQNSLRFITTPGAIWNAEFVFFDEISRCRPDLQNKLFPIIHERRVVGMRLDNLRFRWAAMNPPSPDNPDLEAVGSTVYLGSEPLDPALTDRFPFILPVPNWQDLSREDRRELLSQRAFSSHNGSVVSLSKPLYDLVRDCRERMAEVEEDMADMLVDYMISVMDLLAKAHLPQSPRRARMLVQSIIAIHTARLILEGDDIDMSDSAELALLYGLPHNATEVPPSPASIVATHKQAWEITYMLDDVVWRQILEEQDPIKRVLIGDELELTDDDMSRLITQSLAAIESESRKTSIATAMFLRFKGYRHLTPAAWEPLIKLAGRVILPRISNATVGNSAPDMTIWEEIKPFVLKRRHEGKQGQLEANYLLGGYPDLWRSEKWQDSLAQFITDLKQFDVELTNDK